MRHVGLCSLALAAFVLVAADDAKDDLKKSAGTWVLASGESEGKEIPEEALKTSKLVLKGDKHMVQVGDEKFEGTHKLDATKSPKQIDATDTSGPFKDKTIKGIYSLTKDEFKVCFAPPDKERPTKFTTKSGTGFIYHVWKRQKE